MGAPALDVHWESVKAHALRHGAREAARAFNLNENTVMARCRREGWLANAGQVQIVQELPQSMQPVPARNARNASAAERYSTDHLKVRSKFRLLKAVDKGALAFSRKTGEQVIEQAQQLNALASSHAKLCPPEPSAESRTLVQIAIAGTAPVAVEHSAGAGTTDVT